MSQTVPQHDWFDANALFDEDREGQDGKQYFQAWLNVNQQMASGLPTKNFALSGGRFTPTQAACYLTGAGDLTGINPSMLHSGAELLLWAANAQADITVKHSPGTQYGIALVGGRDKKLSVSGYLHLKRTGDYWFEMTPAFISDVPADGKQYTVKDGAWEKVTGNLELDGNDKVLTQSENGLRVILGCSLDPSTGIFTLTGKDDPDDEPYVLGQVDFPVGSILSGPPQMVTNPPGQPPGTYLALPFRSLQGDETVYVDLSGLVDIYTPGNAAIDVSGYKISLKVDANSGLAVGTAGLAFKSGYQAMTAAESAKLSGIEAGAQVNPTLGGTPSTQAFGDTANGGSSAAAARADHKHAMPPAPTSVSGNAGTATKWQTARTVTVAGDASGSVKIDGSADVTLNLNVTDADGMVKSINSIAPDASGNVALAAEDVGALAVDGTAAKATLLATARTLSVNSNSTSTASFNGGANAAIGVSVTTAAGTAANTLPPVAATALQAWLVVARNCLAWLVAKFDANGNAVSANRLTSGITDVDSTTIIRDSNGIISAVGGSLGAVKTVNGSAPDANGNVNVTSITGNAGTATKLATARSLKVALGSTTAVSFDGSAAQDAIPVSGTLPVANGGTGLTAAPSMLVNLASTSAASPLAASPRPGVTGALPVGNGGTGATSAAAARSALGITLSSVNAATTVLSADLAANTNFTVPAYTLGYKNLLVFMDGILCEGGTSAATATYKENTTTTIQFHQVMPAGAVIRVEVFA